MINVKDEILNDKLRNIADAVNVIQNISFQLSDVNDSGERDKLRKAYSDVIDSIVEQTGALKSS